MRYRVTRFGVHQTALMVASIYFILAVVFTPIVFLAARHAPNGGFPPVMMVLVPIFYGVFGYIATAIGCWLYNLISSWAGGIALTLEPEDVASG